FTRLKSEFLQRGWTPLHREPQRLSTFARIPPERIMPSYGDSLQYLEGSTVIVEPMPINLVTVHAPSKLHQSGQSQMFQAVDFAGQMQRLEKDQGHDRTIVVADRNMNPFEPGMVASIGLHAMMTQDGVRSEARNVRGTVRRFFYTPMWSFFGDLSPGPP